MLIQAALILVTFAQSQGGDSGFVNPIDYSTSRNSWIVTALSIDEKITIDGKLEERAWSQAIPAKDFVQWEPQPGAPASEPTETWFLYDSENLYVGAICYDSEAAKLVSKELKEDFGGRDSDGFGVTLDTLRDDVSGFFFGTNPSGARRDGQIANDGDIYNADWDGVWDLAVTQSDKGWIVEMVIPFKTLRFSSAETQEWGLNILRRVRRKNEDSHWSPVPRRYRGTRISVTGTLNGLEGIRQGRNFKVKPFTVANMNQAGSGETRVTDVDFDGGVDIKYGLSPQLTLDATYRTDFSQVEVDQQQVNLTRFSLFFPEKREFFLENSGIFAFGQPVALVGANGGAVRGNNNLIPFFSRRLGLSPKGTPIPIVGGGRLSGKIGSYDIGVLGMKTESVTGTPSSNFLVGRIKKNLMRTSWIGAIMTNRESRTGDYNRVYGVDARIKVGPKLEIGSYLLRSDTLGLSKKNQARTFDTGWRGDSLSIIGSYHEVQQNFKPDMGYIRREDIRNSAGAFAWRPKIRKNSILNLNFTGAIDYVANGEGEIETREQESSFGISFLNGSSFDVSANRTFDRLVKPFFIRTDRSIAPGDYTYDTYTISYDSDKSQALAADIQYVFGEFWDGRRNSARTTLSLKPNYKLNVDVTYDRNRVRLPSTTFTTNLVGTRLLYAFSGRAFLNTFLQYNSDANQFSSNIRFNFIHHPLSDFFVVYTDRRDTRTGDLVDRALAIKITQLLNF